ncbi:hypothetical protein SPHINGO8BC_60460 [Sphingobacterium multivorum]|uniref:Uncharacterized protein n=1 Tax=Sphingobacterium multivorum TaxID=28454 RepID=A0A654DH77_SPHMU|nr:hypothetical protein SPHINGO8BC_60460 [Sphingobacterium multivorum]
MNGCGNDLVGWTNTQLYVGSTSPNVLSSLIHFKGTNILEQLLHEKRLWISDRYIISKHKILTKASEWSS